MKIRYTASILLITALFFMNISCEKKKSAIPFSTSDLSGNKAHFISPLKRETLSEATLNEIDHMLLAWSHTEWETPPETDFLKIINQPASVKGIVTLWTHSIPVGDQDFSPMLDTFYKKAQPLSMDGNIMTNRNESRAYIKIREGVFLVYQNKEDGKSECAVFYKKKLPSLRSE